MCDLKYHNLRGQVKHQNTGTDIIIGMNEIKGTMLELLGKRQFIKRPYQRELDEEGNKLVDHESIEVQKYQR